MNLWKQSLSILAVCRRSHYLSLNDVKEEVWVAAAAEEVSQPKRLVEAFHLLLDLRRWSTRRAPEHKHELKTSPMFKVLNFNQCRTLNSSRKVKDPNLKI